MGVYGSFIHLSLLEVLLIDLNDVRSLSINLCHPLSSLLESGGPCSPFTGIDESSSGTLGFNHLGLPCKLFSFSGTGSQLLICELSLGSISKFSNSLLDLRGVHFHGASRASWVTGTNLCLALEINRIGNNLFAVSLT